MTLYSLETQHKIATVNVDGFIEIVTKETANANQLTTALFQNIKLAEKTMKDLVAAYDYKRFFLGIWEGESIENCKYRITEYGLHLRANKRREFQPVS